MEFGHPYVSEARFQFIIRVRVRPPLKAGHREYKRSRFFQPIASPQEIAEHALSDARQQRL